MADWGFKSYLCMYFFPVFNKERDSNLQYYVSWYDNFPAEGTNFVETPDGNLVHSETRTLKCIRYAAKILSQYVINKPLETKSIVTLVGRDSSVDIATRYELDGPGIEFRCRARFSPPVQTDPGAHPASYTVGTGSFPGWSGQGVALTTHPHLAPRLKKE